MQKTLKNLTIAFAGESMARNRYHFFAKKAKAEGYQQISEIFMITAENEKEHAESIWEMIDQIKETEIDKIDLETEAPLVWGDTIENLKSAIAGENHEHSEMYPSFAETAEEEGLSDIAARLRAIALAEKHHQERYEKLLKEVSNQTFFKKSEKVEWVCRECGYVHVGTEPPQECPSCHHDKGYFQIKCEEY